MLTCGSNSSKVLVIGSTSRDWKVEVGANARPYPGLGWVPAEVWVIVLRMPVNRYEKNIRSIIEDILGTIPVMNIDVEDCHSVKF
jgi:hypothetical protein